MWNTTKAAKGGVILNTDNDVNRRFVEMCYRTTSTMINPIVDWSDEDVWEFLKYYGCRSNPLYYCGCNRVGCIGCPMQGAKGMRADFEIYPKYKDAYIRAFDRMLEQRSAEGKETTKLWADGESVMKWWIGDNPMQITMFD